MIHESENKFRALSVSIDMWAWRLDADDEAREIYSRFLSDEEAAKADQMVSRRLGDRYRVAHGHLRHVLSAYLGIAPKDVDFHTESKGKPVVHNGPSFNLSHSGDYAVLAVAAEGPLRLGVDIEVHRPIESELAERVFTERERACLSSLPEEQRDVAFFLGWTRKEAALKATGEGLYANLLDIEVALWPDLPAEVLETSGSFPEARHWRIQGFEIAPGVHGACAAITGGAPLRLNWQERI